MAENDKSPEKYFAPPQPKQPEILQFPSAELRKPKSLFGRGFLERFTPKQEKRLPLLELKPKVEPLVPPSYQPLPEISTLRTLGMPEDMLQHFSQLLGETEGRRDGYRFYPSPAERAELRMIFERTAEYLHDNKIKNFILIDRSARPAHIGLREMWKKKYPDTPMPDVYFLNPTGFVNSADAKSLGKTGMPKGMEIMFDGFMKGNDFSNTTTGPRSQEEIERDFETTYQRLVGNKDQPTLLFDTCIHTGDSIKPVQSTMQNLGFADLKIGIVGGSHNFSGISPDFSAIQGEPMGVCYPFDQDRMVERRLDSVTSGRSTKDSEREKGIMLREEIKRIVNQDSQLVSPRSITAVSS